MKDSEIIHTKAEEAYARAKKYRKIIVGDSGKNEGMLIEVAPVDILHYLGCVLDSNARILERLEQLESLRDEAAP